MTVDQTGLTYAAQPGILNQIEVRPENTKTRQSVPYYFAFETRNALFAQGAIGIRIPKEISVDSNNIKFTPVESIDMQSVLEMSYDEQTRILQI